MPTCCVADCAQVGSAKRYCRLPMKYPKLLQLWLEKINNPKFKGKSLKQLSYLRICAKHFEDHFLEKNWENKTGSRLVLPGAYPTLHLNPLTIEEILAKRNIKYIKREENVNVTSEKARNFEETSPGNESLAIKNENSAAQLFSKFTPDTNDSVLNVANSIKIETMEENLDEHLKNPQNNKNSQSIPSKDEAIVLEKFDHNIVHNYSENILTIKKEKSIHSEDKENEKKSEFFKHMHDKIDLDPNKTVIDYVDGKIVWNSVDKSELQSKDQTGFVDGYTNIPKCCICFQTDIDSSCISFYELTDGETYFNKMKATFPDLVFDPGSFSSIICTSCAESLNVAYIFRNTVFTAQKFYETQNKNFNNNDQLTDPPKIRKTIVNKSRVVKDILSILDGIIITKTKTNLEGDVTKPNRYIYACNLCKLKFTDIIPLYKHKIFNHGQSQHRHCIMRGSKAQKSNKELVNNNIQNENLEENPIVQPRNQKLVKNLTQTIYECDRCPKKFKEESRFKVHKKRHDGVKEFCCDKCGKVFLLNSQLQTHLEIHNDSLNYACHTCGKLFKGKNNLKQHEALHRTASVICHICGKAVRTNVQLRYHLLVHSTEKTLKCNYCTATFKRRGELSVHVRRHTNERPFKCDQCDAAFISKQALKLHQIKVHSKAHDFKCDICDKGFYHKKNMLQHRMLHVRNPVSCNICQKLFKNPGTLQRHLKRVHENVRKHQCEICLKQFYEPYELRTHLKVHNNEKFECEKCSKTFKTETNLKVHMEKRHSEMQMYSCDYCHSTFDNYDNIQNHDCLSLLRDDTNSSN